MRRNKNMDENNSVVEWLYEAYSNSNSIEDELIKKDFAALYESMNGMPIAEIDKVIYPVCTLCRDYERISFVEGVKVGAKLVLDLEL